MFSCLTPTGYVAYDAAGCRLRAFNEFAFRATTGVERMRTTEGGKGNEKASLGSVSLGLGNDKKGAPTMVHPQ